MPFDSSELHRIGLLLCSQIITDVAKDLPETDYAWLLQALTRNIQLGISDRPKSNRKQICIYNSTIRDATFPGKAPESRTATVRGTVMWPSLVSELFISLFWEAGNI